MATVCQLAVHNNGCALIFYWVVVHQQCGLLLLSFSIILLLLVVIVEFAIPCQHATAEPTSDFADCIMSNASDKN